VKKPLLVFAQRVEKFPLCVATHPTTIVPDEMIIYKLKEHYLHFHTPDESNHTVLLCHWAPCFLEAFHSALCLLGHQAWCGHASWISPQTFQERTCRLDKL
jgi:hypothetical protein